jgi:hypothetical protein
LLLVASFEEGILQKRVTIARRELGRQ